MLRTVQLQINLDDGRAPCCGMPVTRASGREQGVVGVAELVASAMMRMQATKRNITSTTSSSGIGCRAQDSGWTDGGLGQTLSGRCRRIR